jgi:hypothetical protein
VQLGHQFGISRETVYRVLFENHRIERLRESDAPIPPREIAWLAGLVEGEANISVNGRSLTLRIKMGDRDVISHAASLLGAKVQAATVSDPRGKPMWLAQIKSSKAAEWIMTLYSWLGIRRRQQARDALLAWRHQGHGVIPQSLTEAILGCRRARLSQSEIIALLKVSKSTVYRHTKDKIRRMRVVPPRRRDGEVREHQLRYGCA